VAGAKLSWVRYSSWKCSQTSVGKIEHFCDAFPGSAAKMQILPWQVEAVVAVSLCLLRVLLCLLRLRLLLCLLRLSKETCLKILANAVRKTEVMEAMQVLRDADGKEILVPLESKIDGEPS